MCEPRVSAKIPVHCQRPYKILQDDRRGGLYPMQVPCNNCPPCKERIGFEDILKFKEGLQHQGEEWWQRGFEMNQPDYQKAKRRYLDNLNRHGLRHSSVIIDFGLRKVRYIFHPRIPGEVATSHVTARGIKRTLIAFAALVKLRASREVRPCRASKSRPCWPKSTVERKRDYWDKRPPEQKHQRVAALPLGPMRFAKLSHARLGRIVPDFERLSPLEAGALFTLKRQWLPSSPSKSPSIDACQRAAPTLVSSPAKNKEARFADDDRSERRLERASWYYSSG